MPRSFGSGRSTRGEHGSLSRGHDYGGQHCTCIIIDSRATEGAAAVMSPLATARAPPAYRYSASRAVAASRVPADTPQAATARHSGMGGAALLCLESLYKRHREFTRRCFMELRTSESVSNESSTGFSHAFHASPARPVREAGGVRRGAEGRGHAPARALSSAACSPRPALGSRTRRPPRPCRPPPPPPARSPPVAARLPFTQGRQDSRLHAVNGTVCVRVCAGAAHWAGWRERRHP